MSPSQTNMHHMMASLIHSLNSKEAADVTICLHIGLGVVPKEKFEKPKICLSMRKKKMLKYEGSPL